MFPGLNPRDIEKVMKQMGMKQVDIPASEVLIRCPDKDILVKSPKVSKINMMGQETFQIVGVIEERSSSQAASRLPQDPSSQSLDIDPEDISLVAQQARVSDQAAKKALEEAKGDLAKAILIAKKHPS